MARTKNPYGSGRGGAVLRFRSVPSKDSRVERDEFFYLYVTGEDNHPGSTPGSSRYRATGTIRNDDAEATITKPDITSVR